MGIKKLKFLSAKYGILNNPKLTIDITSLLQYMVDHQFEGSSLIIPVDHDVLIQNLKSFNQSENLIVDPAPGKILMKRIFIINYFKGKEKQLFISYQIVSIYGEILDNSSRYLKSGESAIINVQGIIFNNYLKIIFFRILV